MVRDYATVAFVSAQISLFISQAYNLPMNDIKRLKSANKHLRNRTAGNEPDKKTPAYGKKAGESLPKI